MNEHAENGRDYWRRVLLAGGFTEIPRWTPRPVPGVDTHEAAVPGDLGTALQRLAQDLDVSPSSIVLAAHAKVLAALTGEQEVVTGYACDQARVLLPCRLAVEPGSWQGLIRTSHAVESELVSHRDHPVDELAAELGITEPLFETVFDPSDGIDPDGGAVLRISLSETGPLHDGDQLRLQLRYRTEVLDAQCATRLADYHIAALQLMVADCESEHAQQSLLSAEEYRMQLEELDGPTKELPDRRFHELFEQRVQDQPEAIAAVHNDERWTYRELNARANRVGRALLARGVRRETVVAVVTERNLDWMATVLGIFKAGGVYLPIEPHFPADRIAATISRARCKMVVTEPGSTATLYEALDTLDGVQGLFVETAYREDHAENDLDITVLPSQLAYIYFTSGSTGEPKGAMCEHGGMLNHLYAKIDDLEIGHGQAVAQIAPQCFDISLWQLVTALLVGGRTILVSQETLLDPGRFLDRIVDNEVAVMQVVPSYLEVLLSYLEQHPRDLPDLGCVSVTGEALTFELVQRWFAAQPGIKLANAYGLTETSDDTNHEVMDRPPDGGRVPLGAAVNNVHIRVVDEQLMPVPLGAPGEIVFSGICVGRGYINDPERTGLAFMSDPLREGERLYRSGDFGRWRPDGKLEFLGRRDAQVKIRGFRIEIGEIENAMLQMAGVRQAATIVAEGADRNKHLVGFLSGRVLDASLVQELLGQSLPGYMVPPAIHWREDLPLTDNGKIDRKALAAVAEELALGGTAGRNEFLAPATDSEMALAAVWATVLGVSPERVSRHHNFFDEGGNSLSAVELVIALDSAVSLTDVTRNPVLSELALLIESGSAPRSCLLQPLSEADDQPGGTLVCFPYAGGNAVNFQAMARELRGSGLEILAVELPGHDLTSEAEPFLSIEQVVDQVVAEISEREPRDLFLWGHSSGAAYALAAARRLEEHGVGARRLFIGAQLLGDATHRLAHIEQLRNHSNAEVAAELSRDRGYTELRQLTAAHAEQVGAAYRHDCVSAHRDFVAALENPPSARLAAPVTVVVAADDPSAAGWRQRYRDWELVAGDVGLHELATGGHYFLRTRPRQAAEAVRRTAGLSAAGT